MSYRDVLKFWDYIDKKSFKCDVVDNDGFVYCHIGSYPSEVKAKNVAINIRKVFPSIKFKLSPDPSGMFDLYGDYLKFYKTEINKRV